MYYKFTRKEQRIGINNAIMTFKISQKFYNLRFFFSIVVSLIGYKYFKEYWNQEFEWSKVLSYSLGFYFYYKIIDSIARAWEPKQ